MGSAAAIEKSGPASFSHRRRKTVALADVIVEVFAAFDGSMSTRQVFYQCVSRAAIENIPRNYDRVQRLLVDMRRSGEIPFDRVVDRTRSKHHWEGWDSLEEVLEQNAVQYRRDPWRDQRTVVMVACEKQALEGIFAEEVDNYGTSLWVTRGYPSEAYLFEWADEIMDHNRRGQFVVVPYFGDHDPSGLDIERAIVDGLRRFGAGKGFHLERHGLRFTDIARFDIPRLDVKPKAQGAKAYVERYGNVAAELDALPPAELRARINDAIRDHIHNVAQWNAIRAAERAERESLHMIVRNLPAAITAARAANDGVAR
jgi:hypothetical protein